MPHTHPANCPAPAIGTDATTATAIVCRIGLQRLADGSQLWIESPRTGHRLALPIGACIGLLPPRMMPRIVATVARGGHAATFSSAELKAYAHAAQVAAAV